MNVIEANGARIPAIGLGTMTLKDGVCVEAVKTALRLGYRDFKWMAEDPDLENLRQDPVYRQIRAKIKALHIKVR